MRQLVHPCVFGVMEVKDFESENGPNSMCCETFGGVSSVTKRGSNEDNAPPWKRQLYPPAS
jgi:hypothetical protein